VYFIRLELLFLIMCVNQLGIVTWNGSFLLAVCRSGKPKIYQPGEFALS